MGFEELSIVERLVDKLSTKRFLLPTDIQELVIPRALMGESLLAMSQTGSGKTLAYLLPIVQRLLSGEGRALVLLPTRELAQQVGEVCRWLCDGEGLESAVIYGGVEYSPQEEALARAPQLIISTPGRLIDLIDRGCSHLSEVEYFVLDEVDQMLDLGFHDPILQLSKLRGEASQTLCFSATLSPEVVATTTELSDDLIRIEVESQRLAVESIEQSAYFVSDLMMMDSLLLHLLRRELPPQGVVFTRSRKMADRLAELLRSNGFGAEAMHSDRSQSAREHILGRFRDGETTLLVATDVLARGIDIDTITHVFNYGLPLSAEQYIHRIGRTGRAGRSGRAMSLCGVSERGMLSDICKLMRQNIPIDRTHPYMTQDVTQMLDGVQSSRSSKDSKKVKKRRR